MNRPWLWPLGGWLAAVAVTSVMDATGASSFSALPLCPLFLFLWYRQRLSAKSVGFAWGDSGAWRYYGIAVAYPVVVMAIIAGIAFLGGALDPASAPRHKSALWLILTVNFV